MYLLYSAKLEYRPLASTELLFTPQYKFYVLYLLVYSLVFLLACFLKHQSHCLVRISSFLSTLNQKKCERPNYFSLLQI